MGYRGAVGMAGVEVIIDRLSDTERENRFVEWSAGFLSSKYEVIWERHGYYDVISIKGGDVFDVYSMYWRKARRVMEVLKADVVVGICSSDECIDTYDEFRFKLIISKHKLRRLIKVKRMLEKLVGNSETKGIYTITGNGFVTLVVDGVFIGKCSITLYIDEAVALSGLLLLHVYSSVKLRVFWKMYEEIEKVFGGFGIGLNVKISMWGNGLRINLDTCTLYLMYEGVLLLAYKLLSESIWQIAKMNHE